ncbi:MAG: hypothetical protein HQK79_10565 [Desulfobacterales bacterium]|nr:hypothetical protein [Desulfobacterales bacterium]
MKKFALKLFCIFIIITFMGCATGVDPKNDKQLNALFQALVKNKKELAKKKAEQDKMLEKGLTFEKKDSGIEFSADLYNAPIPDIFKKIMEASHESYILEDDAVLTGKVTTRFQKLSFINALNMIISPIDLVAVKEKDFVKVSLKYKGEVAGAAATAAGAAGPAGAMPVGPPGVYAELAFNNLDVASVQTLLETLYPATSPTPRPIEYGVIPASNTVYIHGDKSNVVRTIQILRQADRKVKHVVIEVLVVEYKTGDLMDLQSKITNMKTGYLKDINLGFNAIGFTQPGRNIGEDKIRNFTEFTALVNFLIEDNKARLISRPYIATRSGKKAQIEIATEGYLEIATAQGGSQAQSVKSGVILNILPIVLDTGKLNMEIQVEDSQFSKIPENTKMQLSVNKNSAQTFMQVDDGQTIIIGGLVLNRGEWGNSGFPFLRKIPIINLLAANQKSSITEKEVAIYITPHVWEPDIVSPLIDPDALTDKGSKKGISDIGSFINKLK